MPSHVATQVTWLQCPTLLYISTASTIILRLPLCFRSVLLSLAHPHAMACTVDHVSVASPLGLFPRRIARVIEGEEVSVVAAQLLPFAVMQRLVDSLQGRLAPPEVRRLLIEDGALNSSTGRCKLGKLLLVRDTLTRIQPNMLGTHEVDHCPPLGAVDVNVVVAQPWCDASLRTALESPPCGLPGIQIGGLYPTRWASLPPALAPNSMLS